MMTDRHELFDGIVAPLARVLAIPHTRFVGDFSVQSFASRILVTVSADPAQKDLKLRVSTIGRTECRALEDLAQLRRFDAKSVRAGQTSTSEPPAPKSARTVIWHNDQGYNDDTEVSHDLAVIGSPPRPGYYSLRTTSEESARCLEVEREQFEVFASFQPIPVLAYDPGRAERPEDYQRTTILAGFGLSTGVAGVLGASFTSKSGRTPPSFDELRSGLKLDRDGTVNYTVLDRSLLAGVAVNWHESVCSTLNVATPLEVGCWEFWRRLHFVGRASVLLNLSFASLGDVPDGVFPPNRRGDLEQADVDFFVMAEVGLGYHIATHHNLRVMLPLLVPKLLKFAGHKHPTEPLYDGRMLLGLGFEYAWNP